jgi:5S rRNA maturation endonuclease (ribonuclease M5)
MAVKLNCIYHPDDTASLAVYEDHFHCYGCGAHGPLEKLQEKVPDVRKYRIIQSRLARENIDVRLDYIKSLPTKEIRGFQLPYDREAYYVVYPHAKFYTKRLFNPKSNSDKYRSPVGHRKPLFNVGNRLETSELFLVEGQLNALSLAAAVPNCAISSPGPCTDFSRPEYVNCYLQYKKIYIIVDKDAAGVAAGVALRETLQKAGKRVVLHPMEQDFNSLHTSNGLHSVREEFQKILEM